MHGDVKVESLFFDKWIFSCLLPDEKMNWLTQAINQATNFKLFPTSLELNNKFWWPSTLNTSESEVPTTILQLCYGYIDVGGGCWRRNV